MNQQNRQRLTAEATTRRMSLENLKSELAGATNRFKLTRNDSDGRAVTDLASRLRLAEIALDGVNEELQRLDKPRPVEITSPRDELLRQRAEIVQKRTYRHQSHEEQVQLVRRRYSGAPEQHIKQYLDNTFGGSEMARRKADADDERMLSNTADQLAEWDRREPPEVVRDAKTPDLIGKSPTEREKPRDSAPKRRSGGEEPNATNVPSTAGASQSTPTEAA